MNVIVEYFNETLGLDRRLFKVTFTKEVHSTPMSCLTTEKEFDQNRDSLGPGRVSTEEESFY